MNSLSLNSSLSWSLTASNGAFSPTTQSGSASFNQNSLPLSTFGNFLAGSYTLSASSTQSINLQSLTNLVSSSTFAFQNVVGVMVQNASTNAGQTVTFSPATSSGAALFFGTSTSSLTLQPGDSFLYAQPSTSSGMAVTTTQSVLKLMASTTTGVAVNVYVWGQ